MNKITFLIFTSLILAGALTRISFANTYYWQVPFNQSSTETWQYAADPTAPIGDFDGIQVAWDSGAKFTTSPQALSGFTDSWFVAPTGDVSAFAHRTDGTTSFSHFFINFEYLSNPLVTKFYYGVFRGDDLIQSQSFSFNGTTWTPLSVDKSTFLTQTAAVTPEPISSALFLLGGAVLGIKRLQRKK